VRIGAQVFQVLHDGQFQGSVQFVHDMRPISRAPISAHILVNGAPTRGGCADKRVSPHAIP
jgi:hypothetical protein